ncbi:uncharacterized protein TrAtP1_007424 [Trichoderma atroviride]|uniref:uncharacterized protein n=1 Tax=Hypocrea atroviridis TaxID=63577 RepID=UPI00331F0EDD|nr:hypothetical protein TrAtP1_007424 [Trichoderma atroviride]
MFACGGHLEAVEAFLPFIGENINLVHRALTWAVEKGSSAVVSRLLQHPGVDVNAVVEGKTALYIACRELHTAVVAILLQAGALPSIHYTAGSDGALHRTYEEDNSTELNCLYALCGHTHVIYGVKDYKEQQRAIFTLLREAGVDISFRNRIGETLLHIATGSPVLVRLLLEAGADANAVNQFGQTPLHIMSNHRNSSLDSMVLLIEEGHANINAVQTDGATPLHSLLGLYIKDIVKKFLGYGPNCNITDKEGNSPLHVFMQHYMTDIDVLKMLLEKGANPNAKNHEGLTPLLCLHNANLAFTEVIELFQDAGADIHEVDRDGNNLLFRLLAHRTDIFGEESHKEFIYLLDQGLSPSQRNYRGQTALHRAIMLYTTAEPYGGPKQLNKNRLDFLINLNLDVKAVDYKGNNLLHTLAMRYDIHSSYTGGYKLISLWKKLINIGLNLEQKNHAGRTPLHILCTSTVPQGVIPEVPTQSEVMPLSFVMSRVKNLDVPDNDGVTPLHIAVTRSETFSKQLLDAGANPLVYTHEGLTPLHLAALSRQSNIVGLLLSAMQNRQNKAPTLIPPGEVEGIALDKKATESEAAVGVNAQMLDGDKVFTPLFYAVMSGRPETVTLLLDAGADVKMGNIFEACLEFEEEIHIQNQRQSARSIRKISQMHRWKSSELFLGAEPSSSHQEALDLRLDDTARLEEIMDMLTNSGADPSLIESGRESYHGSIIKRAINQNKYYTAGCLIRVLRKKSPSLETDRYEDDLARLTETMHQYRKQGSVQALRLLKSHIVKSQGEYETISSKVLTWCLAQREYHLIEEISQLGVSFLPISTEDEHCNLYHLIRLGLVSLFESIASREAELVLSKGDWHAFGDSTRPGLWHAKRDDTTSQLTPFILVAVQRASPNMGIVRLLVEKFAVDIAESDSLGECALFHVVRGNHWWHVHQALPYLLDMGADISMRDEKGQTPLHMALQGDAKVPGPYNWDAAKILIQRGADVNAVDSKGQSCLAYARHNADMIKFLIEHGATVMVDSIFAAIDSRNAEVLRALLSGGLDPNTRRDKLPLETDEGSQNNPIEPHEEFPLYYAASKLRPHYSPSDKSYRDASEAMEVVQVLLDHGADPFAKFLKPVIHVEKRSDFPAAIDTSVQVPEGYVECTLLHEVLLNGYIADTFLQFPSLDVHHRDAKGRTLLHMVCESSKGPDHIIGSHVEDVNHMPEERVHSFQQLLSLGSDLTAQDNFGHNVLHYMLVGEKKIEHRVFAKFLAYTLQNAPELLNQGNCNGETPLHHAMIRAVDRSDRNDTSEAEILLEAGADPMIISKRGDTMLHILGKGIAMAGLRTLFESLAERGIDINARNARGETALFSFYDNPKTFEDMWILNEEDGATGQYVKPLLERFGGDFFVRDNKGRGLLHAAARGDVERFQELLEMGLDPMMEDDAQQTAIDAAAACGNRDILELFEKKK